MITAISQAKRDILLNLIIVVAVSNCPQGYNDKDILH